jgi:hypothetical protein
VKSGVILIYAEDGSLSSVEVLDAARRYLPDSLPLVVLTSLSTLRQLLGWPVLHR